MAMRLSTPVPYLHVLRAWDELVVRELAVKNADADYNLTASGRAWVLAAIWARLGCPGFEPEWYEREWGG